MRHVCLPFLLIAMTASVLCAADSPFEGKWKFDGSQSNIAGAPDVREIEIKQDGNELVVKSKAKPPENGIYPLLWLGVGEFEVKMKNDGSQTTNLFGPYKMQSTTNVDGNKMTTQFVAANRAGEAVSGHWTRTVSPDGKQLTWQIDSKASDGRTLDKTLVFHRK